MKKLSEYKDEEALDLLADIVEPITNIWQDEAVKQAFKAEKKGRIPRMIKAIIKGHKPEVIEIMARLDGIDVKDYHCNILTLPGAIMDILRDDDLLDFFLNAVGVTAPEFSTPATEITTETESE